MRQEALTVGRKRRCSEGRARQEGPEQLESISSHLRLTLLYLASSLSFFFLFLSFLIVLIFKTEPLSAKAAIWSKNGDPAQVVLFLKTNYIFLITEESSTLQFSHLLPKGLPCLTLPSLSEIPHLTVVRGTECQLSPRAQPAAL